MLRKARSYNFLFLQGYSIPGPLFLFLDAPSDKAGIKSYLGTVLKQSILVCTGGPTENGQVSDQGSKGL